MEDMGYDKMSEVSRGGINWFVVEVKSFEILVKVELRPTVRIMEIGSGLLTGRRGKGNIDWNIIRTRLEDSFSVMGLGVEPHGLTKSPLIPKAQLREKGVVLGSLLEATMTKPLRLRDSVWFEVGVLGLPFHLWCHEVFKKIRDACEVFVTKDEDMTCMTEVVPLRGFPVDGFTVVREKEDGSSRATCSKSLKESLVQGSNVSCGCNLGVMGSESKALGSGAGGKGSGLGRLECMGSQPLNRSGSLEKKGMELGGDSFIDPKSLVGVFLAKAQDKIEMEKEGEELGDGLLNGATRGSLETMSLEEVIRMEDNKRGKRGDMLSLMEVGDFNVTIFSCECIKRGRVSSAMRRFSKMIDDFDLRYLPMLEEAFSEEGVFSALCELNRDKALGPDGVVWGEVGRLDDMQEIETRRSFIALSLYDWDGGRLKINLDKSEILPMGRVENVEDLALELGCKVEVLPSYCLGLPLGGGWEGEEIAHNLVAV
ncbi:hypothetical protein AAG906_032377 [Vitis piasezkii]